MNELYKLLYSFERETTKSFIPITDELPRYDNFWFHFHGWRESKGIDLDMSLYLDDIKKIDYDVLLMPSEQALSCWRGRISLLKLNNIKRLLNNCKKIKGATAEVGVYWGWTSRAMKLQTQKRHYAYDTFEGIPNATEENDPGYRYFSGVLGKPKMFTDINFDVVKRILGLKGMHIRKGVFPETAEQDEDVEFSLVHIDGDVYQTTVDSIDFFWPRLLKGGYLVFDDWDHAKTKGVEKAVKEWCDKTGNKWDQDVEGQVSIKKKRFD